MGGTVVVVAAVAVEAVVVLMLSVMVTVVVARTPAHALTYVPLPLSRHHILPIIVSPKFELVRRGGLVDHLEALWV